jgi:Family of unknown function (DUF6152)
MRTNAIWLALLLFGACTMSALAHHSFAMFNREQTIELQGTVKEFQWTNPHAFLEVIVENSPHSTPAVWSIEMNGPRALISQGWRPKSVVPGDMVLLQVYPARNGSNFAQFKSITLSDGKTLGDRRSPALDKEPDK